MPILITGAAGFIGSALALRLLERGERVTGLDNLSDYYDVRLKNARLARTERRGFDFVKADMTDRAAMAALFADRRFDAVVHVAAQAGVRYSIELMRYIRTLEDCLGKKAILDLQPLQPGDVPATYADTAELQASTGFQPATPIEVGVRRFVDWYRGYYR